MMDIKFTRQERKFVELLAKWAAEDPRHGHTYGEVMTVLGIDRVDEARSLVLRFKDWKLIAHVTQYRDLSNPAQRFLPSSRAIIEYRKLKRGVLARAIRFLKGVHPILKLIALVVGIAAGVVTVIIFLRAPKPSEKPQQQDPVAETRPAE